MSEPRRSGAGTSRPTTSEPSWRLRARGLSKDFALRSGGQLTAFHLLRRAVRSRDGGEPVLRALADITLEVATGDVVGVVGNNGAGKTTLLKLIAGIYAPTDGEMEVRGEVGLLSGLGVGMVRDLPVRDNVYLYGAICRLSRVRLDALFDEIIDWAELTDFVRSPLRNLSAGMRTRLAFAVAMHLRAPILLVDEALSAGDQRFKKKCEAYFESLKADETTVLVATHDLEFVGRFCSKTLWLREGRQVAYGSTAEVVGRYRDDTS